MERNWPTALLLAATDCLAGVYFPLFFRGLSLTDPVIQGNSAPVTYIFGANLALQKNRTTLFSNAPFEEGILVRQKVKKWPEINAE